MSMKFISQAGKAAIYLALSLGAFVANAQIKKLEDSKLRVLSDPHVKMASFSKERGTPLMIDLNIDGVAYATPQASALLETFLGVRSGVDLLKINKRSTLTDNDEVISFQQYYKGIKVDRAEFKAYAKNGNLKFYNGAYYAIAADATTKPSISEEQALAYAKERIGATTYVADELKAAITAAKTTQLTNLLQQELQEVSPKGELVFVQDYSRKDEAVIRLAYKFNIYASKPLSRSWVYVDAQNGKILLVDAIIKHFKDDAPPPVATSSTVAVNTRYAGTRTIYVKQISGNDPNNGLLLQSSHPTTETYVPGSPTWVLMDDTRGGGVVTYDLNGVGGLPVSVPPAYTVAKSFTDVDDNWTLAEHKRATEDGPQEAENDDIAWDAHWGAEIVYDYWKARHGRLSYDGNNAAIKSYIHSGLAYDNAFWNGSVMTYGDGSGTLAGGFKPLASLDVCGHEIGHGVCETTSNLIYGNESGAMNEALSDIWAASIEYYAIKYVDPSLKSVYKPFYIGEQISASPATPLRRMDNPKAAGNPDTYGGVNWTNTDGCSPTLANDECGVHNNSGVLNKWYYLITVGSGLGSGPDAAYAGEDDGVNDPVTTGPVEKQHGANTYSVAGLGFAVAEKITFLMETMLSAGATYDEARSVSIAAATQLSGNPCSAMVETVTNAWYAVGVGAKFVKPCTVTYGFPSIANVATTEAVLPSGCNSTKTFTIPVILPPNSTATGTLSGTATNIIDYILSATKLSNTTSLFVKKDLVVTINNDAAVEGDETIIITLSITNTGSNPVNKKYTLTILDDDVTPIIGTGTKTLLSNSFTGADGFNDPAGWTEILEVPEGAAGDPTASGKNQWGIWSNKLAITGKEGTTDMTLPANTYNSNSSSQTLIKSPLINATGLGTLLISFDYTIQGEVDVASAADDPENLPVFDYMAVAYSLDGVNFIELNTGDLRQFAAINPTSGTINTSLPAALTNRKFYLAFRWVNDTNGGGPYSVSIDNLTIKGKQKIIENDLGHNAKENLPPGVNAYFYTIQQSEVIAKVKNGSTKDYGCTDIAIEKTGNKTFTLYTDTAGSYNVSEKVVRMTPTYANSGSNTVVLYYTESELKGLESATGKSRKTFSVFVVDAPAYTGATAANTKKYTPSYTSISGVGGYYTFTFTGKLTGSYAVGTVVAQSSSRSDITMVDDGYKFDAIYPNPGKNNAVYGIKIPVAQKMKIDVVNMYGQLLQTQTLNLTSGYSKLQLQTGKLQTGSYLVYIRNEKGQVLNIQKYVKE